MTVVDRLVANGSKGDTPKVVFKTETLTDVASLVSAGKLFSLAERKFALIGMDPGSITRVCANRFGASLTYVSLEPGKEAAPGQIDLATMKWLGNKAIITGITGHPLSIPSRRPCTMPRSGRSAFRGCTFQTPGGTSGIGIGHGDDARPGHARISVTIPHKESIISLLDRLDMLPSRLAPSTP